MKKRVLSLVLTVLMLFSLVPFQAFAVEHTHALGGSTFTTQPKDVTVNPGQTAVFTAAATNSDSKDLIYIWFDADKVNVDDLDFKDLSAMIDKIKAAKLGDGKTLRLTNVTDEQNGLRVRCAVYYEKALTLITIPKDLTFSNTATLTVLAEVCDEHTLTFVPGTPATCAEEGNLPYYYCTVCGRCYLDEEAQLETTVLECTIAILKTHDDVVFVEETVGNCCEKGLSEHYYCNTCGRYFSDEEAQNEVTKASLETAIDEDNHKNLVEYPEKAATCCEKGNTHYWYCDGCRGYYSDAEAKNPIKHSDTEIAKDDTNHSNLVEYPAKLATCKEAGNIHYWYCDGCRNYYSDSEGTNKISKSDTELKKLDHDYQWTAFNENGVEYHAQQCSMCKGLVNTGSHSGGTAYCHGKAVCETCGFEYGEIDPDTHINTELKNFVAPTPDTEGYSGDLYCVDCGALIEEGHVTDKACAHELKHIAAKDPTCCEEGNIEYWQCSICNVCYTDETALTEIAYEDTLLETVSHSYTKWIITETAHQKVCEWCDKAQPLIYESPKEHVMSTGEPTCHNGHYCLICGYDDGERDPSNHDGDTEVRDAYEPDGSNAGYTGDTYCLGCGEKLESGRYYYNACADGCANNLYFVAGTERTCYEDGIKDHFICTVCGNMYLDAKATVPTDEAGIVDKCTGHDLHPGTDAISANSLVTLLKAAGFTDLSLEEIIQLIKDATSGDISGDISVEDFLKNVHLKDIDHCYDDNCHWLGCQRCGKTLEDLVDELAENGINLDGAWIEIGKKEAHSGGLETCTEQKVCDECGEHYGPYGEHRYKITVTAPTCTENGYTTHKCNYCNDEYVTDIIPATGHKIVKGKCENCGTYYANPFYDVKNGDIFYTAVMWAYTFVPQITAGVTDNYFKPYDDCTRGQVVTFLWRAAGRPEPQSTVNNFKDVSSTGACAPYYTAILWAAEQGITTGYNDGTFKPHQTVSRAEFVTFLWRYYGKPAASTAANPFKDVSNNSVFCPAILWAYGTGITTGYGGDLFKPNQTCSRWQVVMFMYRAICEGKAY